MHGDALCIAASEAVRSTRCIRGEESIATGTLESGPLATAGECPTCLWLANLISQAVTLLTQGATGPTCLRL
jgi:hypothetical protein